VHIYLYPIFVRGFKVISQTSRKRGFLFVIFIYMRKKNCQEELNLKINKLKLQLKKLSAQIENDRDENFAEDSSIRLELLDKRDIITQQITKLQDSMNSKSNPEL